MGKSKKCLALSLAALFACGVAGTVIGLNVHGAKQVDAADSISIGTKDEFLAAFNGSAEKNAYTINLTADIDLGGVSKGLMMAGDFSGTLNGNGYTVSNVTLTQAMFNIVSGSISDLTLIDTASGSGFGSLAYSVGTNGTIDNVKVYETYGAAVNNHGPIAFFSQGTISNCYAKIDTSTYPQANTNFHMARADAGSTFANDSYTVVGTGTFLTDPTGVTVAVDVSAVSVGDVSVAEAKSVIATAALTGNLYDHIKWTIGDTAVATIASSTGKTVSVTGVAAGSTTLVAKVYADSAEETLLVTSAEANVTVTAPVDVSAVTLDKDTLSVAEGGTGSLTATLTGDNYSTIAWASDSANATVSGSGLTAVVTGVTQGGTATITVTVTLTNSTTFTDTCVITVVEPEGFYIYFFDDMAWTDCYAFVYGDGAPNTAMQMSKVTKNEKQVAIYQADTNKANAMTSYNLWKLFYNTSTNAGAATSFVQFNSASSGRWGAGVQLNNSWTKDVVIYNVGNAQSTNNTKDSVTGDNLAAAIDFAGTYATYATSGWRDAKESICYLLETANADAKKTKVDAYDALTSDVKHYVNLLDDSTTDYKASLGATMAILGATVGGSVSVGSLFENSNSSITILAISGVVLVSIIAGALYFSLRKRKANR